MKPEEIIELIKSLKNKPTGQHFLCYGGSTIKMVNSWASAKDSFDCRYAGDKNWLTPMCETCDGKVVGTIKLNSMEIHENRMADKIISEIEKRN